MFRFTVNSDNEHYFKITCKEHHFKITSLIATIFTEVGAKEVNVLATEIRNGKIHIFVKVVFENNYNIKNSAELSGYVRTRLSNIMSGSSVIQDHIKIKSCLRSECVLAAQVNHSAIGLGTDFLNNIKSEVALGYKPLKWFDLPLRELPASLNLLCGRNLFILTRAKLDLYNYHIIKLDNTYMTTRTLIENVGRYISSNSLLANVVVKSSLLNEHPYKSEIAHTTIGVFSDMSNVVQHNVLINDKFMIKSYEIIDNSYSLNYVYEKVKSKTNMVNNVMGDTDIMEQNVSIHKTIKLNVFEDRILNELPESLFDFCYIKQSSTWDDVKKNYSSWEAISKLVSWEEFGNNTSQILKGSDSIDTNTD